MRDPTNRPRGTLPGEAVLDDPVGLVPLVVPGPQPAVLEGIELGGKSKAIDAMYSTEDEYSKEASWVCFDHTL